MYITLKVVNWIETGPNQHIYFTDNVDRPIATGEYDDDGYTLLVNDDLLTFSNAAQAFSHVNDITYRRNSQIPLKT